MDTDISISMLQFPSDSILSCQEFCPSTAKLNDFPRIQDWWVLVNPKQM